MQTLFLKTYDEVKDRSPFYCAGGVLLLGLLAWREFAEVGAVNLRLVLMGLTMLAFVLVAFWLVERHRIKVEIMESEDPEVETQLVISKLKGESQVILKSKFAYVKKDEGRVVIHYYDGDDLKHTYFPIKRAGKKKVQLLVEHLATWRR
ncbi:MAG: hypothetical protein QM496_01720 [Verrucomicrobiota bacterium]